MSHTTKNVISTRYKDYLTFTIDCTIYRSKGNQHTIRTEIINDNGELIWSKLKSFKQGNTLEYAEFYVNRILENDNPNRTLIDVISCESRIK